MKLASIIVRQDDTHRLVARQYVLDEQGPLSRLADDEAELSGLTELERSTDNRVLGESGLLLGISIHELVFGVPYAPIVNAAFTYAHPTGNSSNGPERGAWYAGFRLETWPKWPIIGPKSFRRSTGLILRFSSTWSISLIFGAGFTTSGSNQTFTIVCHPIAMPPHSGWLKCFLRKVQQESFIRV